MAAAREHGELVDRLMARISALEARLYTQQIEEDNFTIPAIHGASPSPRTAAATAASQLASSVNRDLLDTLGDPDRAAAARAEAAAGQTVVSTWRTAASSWISATPLARTALQSLSKVASQNAMETSADGTTAVISSEHSRNCLSAEGKEGDCSISSTNNTDDQQTEHGQEASIGQEEHMPRTAAESPVSALGEDAAGPRGTASQRLSCHPNHHPSLAPPSCTSLPASASTGQHTAGATVHTRIVSPTPSAHSQAGHRSSRVSEGSHSSGWSGFKSYYRYIMSPVQEPPEGGDQGGPLLDVQQVQEAAGTALAEANERLLEAELRVQSAQAAQRQLQVRLEAAEQLQQDLEQLKIENLEAWRQKYDLESQLAAARANMEGLQGHTASLHKELDDLRLQARIHCDTQHTEDEKLRAEVQLLNEQLLQRSDEASALRQQLTEARAERDRALQEKQQATEERDRLQQQLQQLSNLQQQLAAATTAAAESAAKVAEFQEKFMHERAVRRRLHEQLQILRGNIRVMCRVRPALSLQQPTSPQVAGWAGNSSCISVPLEGLLSVNDVMNGRQREYEFDAVFGPEATQQQVFEEVLPLVRSCADGYNACIFAYGQTGSGKTYTMQGPSNLPGINSRALKELFKIAADEGEGPSPWSFCVSMMEVYNDSVRDLLAMAAAGICSSSNTGSAHSTGPSAAAAAHSGLEVSGLPAGEVAPHMDRVPGLLWRDVTCAEDVEAVLREGWRARATAATALNAASSRSHAVLCVKVRGFKEGQPFTALLHLVDLAGSERVDRSEVSGQQLKEAQAINKSLSALGDVIAALQRRSSHIPFRNSKLTQVLQDSLCGSSKVLLVCNLSPEAASCGETLSSLTFASRAAQVELGQARRATTGHTAAAASWNDLGPPLSPEPSSSSLKAQAATNSAGGAPGSSSSTLAAALGPGVKHLSTSKGLAQQTLGSAANTIGRGVSSSAARTTPQTATQNGKAASRMSERAPGSSAAVLINNFNSLSSPRGSSMAKPARH